ncbi:15859_t:CDS:2, partial [Dentiscutata heterogama]
MYLQPCNAGIIWSFKVYYYKLFCKNHIATYEEAIETENFKLVNLTLQRLQELKDTDIITEIQSLISQLLVTNPIKAKNFIEIDYSVKTDIMSSNNKIINTILDSDCNKDDKNESEVCISYKKVITNINNILLFINQDDRFKVDEFFVKKLNRFKKDVVRD